ncbi:YcaO-like family protein [Pseudomonas vancouverensis]|uniref:YcaO domain-containing protein n=1 Tax=Pseudomonas vancouverensis TaxID=95300 RepID=A0A1H2NK77_PSEVA|nr:YcaO-like family protein [Pseudomonas vancouverensis]KAB0495143.1 hypothetical protein F7R09_16305 [Pseudomonas vancouverensis]TDB57096.1 hypothetical protein EIY72_27580 [Pseudomonas vancouverensis]SDV05718.1 ribosomal protein S12 methylthiotransferase accessory factor [Pseudomonas vancouverensis]
MSEREFSPSEALLKIQKIVHSLNLSAVTHHADTGKLVATAQLFDANNNLIESGAGKGPDSLIGALAESIEHFSTFQLNENDLSTQHCDFITTQKAAEHDGFLRSLPYENKPTIECLKLTTFDGMEELFIPAILLCPRMANESLNKATEGTRFLSRYSSNSGIAFGCTKAEALLHGTHEIIERHLLSRFFMAVCEIGPAIQLYTPSKMLLAKALQDNPYALTQAEKLQIIIIKDIMNVYFSVALPKAGAGNFHISPIGSGCSLDIYIAIQRAVTEQFQVDALYDDAQHALDRRTLDLLASSEKLKHLIDFSPIINKHFPVIDTPLKKLSESVTQQLDLIENHARASGKRIFHRCVAQYPGNGIVCQSYIPGLERFNLIRNGCLVVPQRVLRQI